MTFTILALIMAAGLLGPLIALPRSTHLPVVLGELLGGLILGKTGLNVLHSDDPSFTALADVGFALVMFVAGSHVPIREPALRTAFRTGALRAAAVGVVAAGLGTTIAAWFGAGHGAVYAVLIASSSAALILPIVDSLGLSGGSVLALLPQVALADTACIIALPLAIDPPHALTAGLGAVLVIMAGGLIYLTLNRLERNGTRRRAHRVSEHRGFALELRISLLVLFSLAGLAQQGRVSIMLAGFVFGLVVAAIGQPRRLARQVFAVTEGFLAPVFFVWLGSSLDLGDLWSRPALILLGLALGAGAVTVHLVPRLWGQPVPMGLLASAQLGVPVAAAALGTRLGTLAPGESAALILGALISIAAATAGGSLAARAGAAAPDGQRHDRGPKAAGTGHQ